MGYDQAQRLALSEVSVALDEVIPTVFVAAGAMSPDGETLLVGRRDLADYVRRCFREAVAEAAKRMPPAPVTLR